MYFILILFYFLHFLNPVVYNIDAIRGINKTLKYIGYDFNEID
jgi:hypothetical protein